RIEAKTAARVRGRVEGVTAGAAPERDASERRSRTVARSRARSLVETYRPSGSLARQRSTIHRKGAGASGFDSPTGLRSSVRIAESVSIALPFWKALFPVAIS